MEIKISANPGEEPKPVSKIASGGEISRIMLAIKTILADRQPAPVMIFDEIDSGVGGVTADRVGEKLKALALTSQVFCVTHLAQVASQATAHYGVRKKAGKTETGVEAVKTRQRGENRRACQNGWRRSGQRGGGYMGPKSAGRARRLESSFKQAPSNQNDNLRVAQGQTSPPITGAGS